MSDKLIVLVPLSVVALGFVFLWWRALSCARCQQDVRPNARHVLVGVVTDFFDTLGIGSFATTTSIFRLGAMCPDGVIPGTLNVGHTLPTVAQALIYIVLIDVELPTLAILIGASVLGALLGAGRVATWPERRVRLGMGLALLGAAALMLARALGLLPPGGDAMGLHGAWLWVGALGNFMLGALMTMGIGLYAPCMILVSLLGMNPTVAFPIMMGSCAFLMPVASARFIRKGAYSPRAALGLAIGGVPAVLVAAYWVKQLPLDAVRWLVLVVVLYTAILLLRAASVRANAAAHLK